MSCDIKIEDLPKIIKGLYEKVAVPGVAAAITNLHDMIADTATLAMYFNKNNKSESKLVEVEVGDPVAGMLQVAVDEFVANEGKVNTDYDKLGINPVYESNKPITEGWQSMLGLVYNKATGRNGKFVIKAEVSKAIGIATNEWLASVAEPSLPGRRSDDDIRSMLGMDRKSTVSVALRTEMEKLDVMYNHSVNEIGSKVYKLLGIKAKVDTLETNYSVLEAKFKTELGMLAIAAMESKGSLVIDSVDLKVGNKTREGVKIIRFTGAKVVVDGSPTIQIGGARLDKTGAERLYDETLNNDTKHGVYSSAEDASPRRDEIINDGISGTLGDVVSSTHKDAVIRQSKTANYMREGYNKAIQILEGIATPDGGSLLRSMLGHIDENSVIAVTRPAVIGKNTMIDDTIKYLGEAYGEYGTGSAMYARWKVITNNRFMIDSNKLNWQDKKLHRYAVYNKAVKVTNSNRGYFKLALAQSLGIDIDKLSAKTLLVGDNSMIDTKLEELSNSYDVDGLVELPYNSVEGYVASKEFEAHLVELVEVAISGNKGEPEHLISGVVELLQSNFAVAKGLDYYSQIGIETDAITSGYAIKNVQIPILFDSIEGILAELEKMGIFSGDSKYAGYGDRVEGRELDSYQDPANVLTEKLNGIDVPTAILKLVDPKGFKEGKFTGISRAFMKNPFMVLNYGSAVKSIVSATAAIAEENLYKQVNDYYKAVRTDDSSVDRLREGLVGIAEALNSKDFIVRLDNNTEGFRLSSGEANALRGTVLASKEGTLTFGNALEDTLTTQYSEYIELTAHTNSILTAQFRVAKAALDSRIEKLHSDRVAVVMGKDPSIKEENASRLVPPVSKQEITMMVQSLAKLFPVLNAPLKTDSGKYSQILIAGTERASSKGDVELLGNIASPGIRTVSKGLTHGAMEVYKLVEAYSAGAVIPIHFFDGSVQAEVLSKYDALGVHDANYFNIDEVIEGTKYYNKSWMDMNKRYNLVNEIMTSTVDTFLSDRISGELDSIMDKLDGEYSKKVGNKTVSYRSQIVDTIEALADIEIRAEAMREELFSKDLYVEHAYAEGVDGEGKVTTARYKSEGGKYDKKITPQVNIDAVKAKLDVTEDTVLKASTDYLPEVNISSEERIRIDKVNDLYIARFGIKVKFGDEFAYNPDGNEITIIKDAEASERAVYTAHEVKHAVTYKWLKDGKNRKGYQYLVSAMESLKDLDYTADADGSVLKTRLEYAMSRNDEFSRVAELVAILHSEPNVRKTFLEMVPQKQVLGVKAALKAIKSMLGMVGKVDTSMVISTVDSIVEDALTSQINSKNYYNSMNDAEAKVVREELTSGGKLVAYASIGKSKIGDMLTSYTGIDLSKNKTYRVVELIDSSKKGLGYADAVMGHVVNKYGDNDLLLEVYPMDDMTSGTKLVSWYGKYGFEVVNGTGSQVIMIRNGSSSEDTGLNAGIIATKEIALDKCKG